MRRCGQGWFESTNRASVNNLSTLHATVRLPVQEATQRVFIEMYDQSEVTVAGINIPLMFAPSRHNGHAQVETVYCFDLIDWSASVFWKYITCRVWCRLLGEICVNVREQSLGLGRDLSDTNHIFNWKIGVLDDYHLIVTTFETLSASGNDVFAFISWYP